MKAYTDSFSIMTNGKGTYKITPEVTRIVRESGVSAGIATVFIQHTSASLIIYENADPSARTDLHEFFERLVPEDQDYFVHTDEGSDDMPSHLRMVLTRTSEVIPSSPSMPSTEMKRNALPEVLSSSRYRLGWSASTRCSTSPSNSKK